MSMQPGDMVMFRVGVAELARGADDPMPRLHPAMVSRVRDGGRLDLTIFWAGGISDPVTWRAAVPHVRDAAAGSSCWDYRPLLTG